MSRQPRQRDQRIMSMITSVCAAPTTTMSHGLGIGPGSANVMGGSERATSMAPPM